MPNNGWDFQVQRITLNALDVDASKRLGMIIVQPDYGLEPDGEPSFRISERHRQTQYDLIEQAFQIRAAESPERGVPIPFIVFPELAIPVAGPHGLDCLCQQMEQAQGEVIFIGGLEGLSPQEAHAVADHFEVERPDFSAGSFVNLCVIVVKSADGQVRWHFQAKLRPSQWEQPRNMACGQRVFYFVAPNVAFLGQICFDHIAQEGEQTLNSTLRRQIIEAASPDAAPLDYLFVPQYNEKPNAPSFRENTNRLVNFQHRLFHNNMMATVVANKAATLQESPKFGRSGFHYAKGRWQVSKTDIGPNGYELYDSNSVTSAVFRKRTPAIHVATLVPATDNIGNPGNQRQPLETPRTYLIGDGCDSVLCAHLPGTQGPTGAYVECDCLPCKLRDSLLEELPTKDNMGHRWKGSDDGQSALIKSHYGDIRQSLLTLNCQRAVKLLDLLFLAHEDRYRNPDKWRKRIERDGVCEFASAMSVLREHCQMQFDIDSCWTAVLDNGVAITVLDGAGSLSYSRLATQYLRQHQGYSPAARSKPVLIVALRSTGHVDQIVAEFPFDFTQTQNRGLFNRDSIYEPARVRAFVCRGDLFEEARESTDLGNYLNEKMEVVYG